MNYLTSEKRNLQSFFLTGTFLFSLFLAFMLRKAVMRWITMPAISKNRQYSSFSLSVIIPAFNEERSIEKCLLRVKSAPFDVEIIVIDGGSTDNTVKVAKKHCKKVLCATPPSSRSKCLNRGAEVAKGDILLFLHADTLLPLHYESTISNVLHIEDVKVGAFGFKVDERLFGISLIENLANWRARYLGMPYGDQALFMHRSTFFALGGFPNQNLMEDFDFITKAHQHFGTLHCVHSTLPSLSHVLTSARRWKSKGVLFTSLFNQLIIFCHFIGIESSQLSQWYYSSGSAF